VFDHGVIGAKQARPTRDVTKSTCMGPNSAKGDAAGKAFTTSGRAAAVHPGQVT